jgi:hypothetical protein
MEPAIKPLARSHRRWLFVILLLIFLAALPVFVFYATGYRFDHSTRGPAIIATGGLYILTDAPDAVVYLNEEEVQTARVFRNASYLQGIEPGLHRLHVQVPQAATWVKELPVHPHLVTEAEAFNLPLSPQVRPITRYLTAAGLPVVLIDDAADDPFAHASVTVPFVATTSRDTGGYRTNSEYAFIADLFAERDSVRALIDTLFRQTHPSDFSFATTVANVDFSLATTTLVEDNIMLFEAEGEVYARSLGRGRQIPSYFCEPNIESRIVPDGSETPKTPLVLGNVDAVPLREDLGRSCRSEIRIDRKGQTVHGFSFLPGNTDLVLMHLDDGLYVVEIDDRSWQNTQLLYPGADLAFVIYGGRIYVRDGENYLEVFTRVVG